MHFCWTYIFTFDSLDGQHPQVIRNLSAYLKKEALDKKRIVNIGNVGSKSVPVHVILKFFFRRILYTSPCSDFHEQSGTLSPHDSSKPPVSHFTASPDQAQKKGVSCGAKGCMAQ